MKLTEDLLHFIWRYKLFNALHLRTTEDEELRVLNFGQYNTHAGPDFEYAQLQINQTLWSGHVEMHLKASDWLLHKHHLDPAYNTTILHVVWDLDTLDVRRMDGSTIATLILRPYVEERLLSNYQQLMENLNPIACSAQLSHCATLKWTHWLDRMSVERLQQKYDLYQQWIDATKGDWERIFLISLARAMGMQVNSSSFEELFRRLPLQLIRKYHNQPLKIEAILFGLAGFLDAEVEDTYVLSLKNEFEYLQKLHLLQPMPIIHWKFMRMRPPNFPTIRLAQLAALLCQDSGWFGKLLQLLSIEDFTQQIVTSVVNPYWKTHYRFGHQSGLHKVQWSKDMLNHIGINALIPTLYAYGVYIDKAELCERALSWLQQLSPENNKYVRSFMQIGVSCHSAADSQALLHLFKSYCQAKKCLHCAIGLQIMK